MIHPLVVELVLAVPNPTPEQPPGTEGITTMLNWLAWAAIVGGLAGFLGCAAKLGVAAFTGRATEAPRRRWRTPRRRLAWRLSSR